MTPLYSFKETFAAKPTLGLTFLYEERMIIDHWRTKIESVEVELARKLSEAHEANAERPFKKWLVNLTKVKKGLDSSNQWLHDVLIPLFLNDGLYFVAIVRPEFSPLSQNVIEFGDRKIGQFSNFDEAYQWLLEQ